jgi:Mitochondrial ribosomal protein L37
MKLQGSIPGGTPFFGLAYLKANPNVLAMEDDAYPEWLWGLLDEGKNAAVSGEAADLSCALYSWPNPIVHPMTKIVPPLHH